ncbi:Hypothetical predicted protein [Scomber scombrus]|uniref:Uncharacterized protein n=1 Tax=Scomber scombrus TaxID=13677 RepID=A0AAV1Q4C5_SCOSC
MRMCGGFSVEKKTIIVLMGTVWLFSLIKAYSNIGKLRNMKEFNILQPLNRHLVEHIHVFTTYKTITLSKYWTRHNLYYIKTGLLRLTVVNISVYRTTVLCS